MREDAVFRLIVNMVASSQQALAVTTNLTRVAQQYLGLRLSYLGHILRDPHVAQGVMQTHPFILRFPNAPATKCVHDLAIKIIQQKSENKGGQAGFFRRFAQTIGIASNA